MKRFLTIIILMFVIGCSTATPQPTATPSPPTATHTPVPTSTPAPTATPSAELEGWDFSLAR